MECEFERVGDFCVCRLCNKKVPYSNGCKFLSNCLDPDPDERIKRRRAKRAMVQRCNLVPISPGKCVCLSCEKTILLRDDIPCERIATKCDGKDLDLREERDMQRFQEVEIKDPPTETSEEAPKEEVKEDPEPSEFPSLASRISHFTIAAIQHHLRGSPTCTQEEIDERYAICEVCPKLRRKKGKTFCAHAGCGCNVNNAVGKYMNKLAWADQSCPESRWKAIKK